MITTVKPTNITTINSVNGMRNRDKDQDARGFVNTMNVDWGGIFPFLQNKFMTTPPAFGEVLPVDPD
jgi:hypothetical protein